MAYKGLIDRYREYLPKVNSKNIVTLHEGNTPLIESSVLSQKTGLRVYFKYEGFKPDGVF